MVIWRPLASSRLTPDLAAGGLFFVLPLIFVPPFYDPAEAPRWALLSVMPVVACLLPARFTPGHALGLAFVLWAAVTLQWSPGPYEGLNALWKLIVLGALFRIGSALPTLRPVFLGVGVAFAINGAIVTAQWLSRWYGFPDIGIPQLASPAGLFMNKNFAAEPAALVLVGLVAYRVWWLAAAVLPCVALTSARGALLALGAAGAAWVWSRSRLLAVVLALGVACAGLGLWQARTYNITDTGRQRFVIWTSTLADMTPFGRGLGAFYVRFPEIAPEWNSLVSRPSHAHNDLLELAYETGPGILLVLGLLAYCLAGPSQPARLVLVAFTAESLLSFPTWFAVSGSLAALIAGHLCRDRPSLRFHLALGRIRLQRFAADIEWD